MDEHLFIAMAKLKADRGRLERGQQAAAAIAELPVESIRSSAGHSTGQSPKTRWFSRAPQWREQS